MFGEMLIVKKKKTSLETIRRRLSVLMDYVIVIIITTLHNGAIQTTGSRAVRWINKASWTVVTMCTATELQGNRIKFGP